MPPMTDASKRARSRTRSTSASRARKAKIGYSGKRPRTIALKSSSRRQPKKKETSDAKKAQYMSPKGKEGPPIQPGSLGHFLCVNDQIRSSMSTTGTAGDGKTVIIFHPSVRGVFQVIHLFKPANHTAGNPVAIQSSYHLSPTWKYQTSDTPQVYRPLRASVKISNMSPADQRVNGCTILNTSSPMVLDFCSAGGHLWSNATVNTGPTGWPANTDANHVTEACFNRLYDMTNTSPDSKFYTANALSVGHNEFVNFPCTSSAYMSYGARFDSGGGWNSLAASWSRAQTDMPMSAMVLSFADTTGKPNAYTIEYQTQGAARYDESTLLGSLQKSAPEGQAAAANIFNAVQRNGANRVTASGSGS
jgi:hypothetical protein